MTTDTTEDALWEEVMWHERDQHTDGSSGLRADVQRLIDYREARYAEVVKSLEWCLALMGFAPKGAFENGVKDSTGAIDEGEVRASEIYHSGHAALTALKAGANEEVPHTDR